MNWLKKILAWLFPPKPVPPTPPAPVVLFYKDFTGSKFSWSDWYAYTCKGMRALYPDYMNRVIWIKDNVVPSKEGLQLIATTGSAIKPDWKSDGYYTFDWFRRKFNFCGQICSYDTGVEKGLEILRRWSKGIGPICQAIPS